MQTVIDRRVAADGTGIDSEIQFDDTCFVQRFNIRGDLLAEFDDKWGPLTGPQLLVAFERHITPICEAAKSKDGKSHNSIIGLSITDFAVSHCQANPNADFQSTRAWWWYARNGAPAISGVGPLVLKANRTWRR